MFQLTLIAPLNHPVRLNMLNKLVSIAFALMLTVVAVSGSPVAIPGRSFVSMFDHK